MNKQLTITAALVLLASSTAGAALTSASASPPWKGIATSCDAVIKDHDTKAELPDGAVGLIVEVSDIHPLPAISMTPDPTEDFVGSGPVPTGATAGGPGGALALAYPAFNIETPQYYKDENHPYFCTIGGDFSPTGKPTTDYLLIENGSYKHYQLSDASVVSYEDPAGAGGVSPTGYNPIDCSSSTLTSSQLYTITHLGCFAQAFYGGHCYQANYYSPAWLGLSSSMISGTGRTCPAQWGTNYITVCQGGNYVVGDWNSCGGGI